MSYQKVPLPLSLKVLSGIAGWWRGVVVIAIRRMNKVTPWRARFVLGWVTVFGRVYHHGM